MLILIVIRVYLAVFPLTLTDRVVVVREESYKVKASALGAWILKSDVDESAIRLTLTRSCFDVFSTPFDIECPSSIDICERVSTSDFKKGLLGCVELDISLSKSCGQVGAYTIVISLRWVKIREIRVVPHQTCVVHVKTHNVS